VPPPTILAESATGITSTNATLNMTVDPRGHSSTVYFQYGTTTSYGSFTSSNTLSGNVAVGTNASVSGLLPGTTYHFSVVASNAAGTTLGSDVTLTTLAAPPQATTLAASNNVGTNVNLNASINPGGAATTFYFQYGTTTNYGSFSLTNTLAAGLSTVVTNTLVSGLVPITLYHFRVVAMNSAGSSNGSDLTFTTTIAVPQATTLAATNITATNANLRASINPDGAATTFYFQYGTSTNYGSFSTTNTLAAGTSAVVTNTAVTGLIIGTLYHFQVVAGNSAGSSVGADLTFNTLAVAPQATTLVASNNVGTNVNLNASINPGGGATTFYFQYGTTTNYGSFSLTNTLAAGLSTVVTNTLVSGLVPITLYHFRVVAMNSAGSSNGSDLTFTTPIVAPQVTTLGAFNITAFDAILNFSMPPSILVVLPQPFISSTAPAPITARSARPIRWRSRRAQSSQTLPSPDSLSIRFIISGWSPATLRA
jgi:hypothetical protein